MARKGPYWTTSKFKRLQAQWKRKLEKSGFKDIEANEYGDLTNSSNPFRDQADSEVADNKAAYFRMMSQAVQSPKVHYESDIDRIVMTSYVGGKMIKDICKELKQLGYPRHRQTVRLIIHRYEDKWGVRKWNRRSR